jgi:UTP--glucose-1-phosphate uridylyltransferase
MRVEQMIEKPSPEQAPSRMGVSGRYILTPAVFDHIRNNPRGAGGEIQLTDGIARLIDTEGVHAYSYKGKRYDCGSKLGFLEATVDFALKHPEVGQGFRDYLQALRG